MQGRKLDAPARGQAVELSLEKLREELLVQSAREGHDLLTIQEKAHELPVARREIQLVNVIE